MVLGFRFPTPLYIILLSLNGKNLKFATVKRTNQIDEQVFGQ